MKHHLSTIILGSALALGGTAALASPVLASQQGNSAPATQSRLVVLTHNYFVALNHALLTRNYSNLRSVFAARATLTERSSLTLIEPTPQISTAHGRSAIINVYRHLSADVAGRPWIVGVMNQVSPSTMAVYARIAASASAPSLYSMQRLTVRSGKIVQLELTLYDEQ